MAARSSGARIGAKLLTAFFVIVALALASAAAALVAFQNIAAGNRDTTLAIAEASRLSDETRNAGLVVRSTTNRALTDRTQAALELAQAQIVEKLALLDRQAAERRTELDLGPQRRELTQAIERLAVHLDELKGRFQSRDEIGARRDRLREDLLGEIARVTDKLEPLRIRAEKAFRDAAAPTSVTDRAGLAARAGEMAALQSAIDRMDAIRDATAPLIGDQTAAAVTRARNTAAAELQGLVQQAVYEAGPEVRAALGPALAKTSDAVSDDAGLFRSALEFVREEAAIDDIGGEAEKAANDVVDVARTYVAAASEYAAERTEASQAEVRSAQLLVAGFVTLAFVAACLILWLFVFRRIVRPIDDLTETTRRLAAGDLSARPAFEGSSEFADMEQALERFRANALALQTSEARMSRVNSELARSNAELEQFAYMASHDLQEPLRIVGSYCELLEQRYADKLDDAGKEFIAYAVDGARRMRSLIDDLLRYSRVGREDIGDETFDLEEAITTARTSLGRLIEEEDATIDVADMPLVYGNANLIAQVFQNLIANAVKFKSEDKPHIRISAKRDSSMWRIRVEDNGIGIKHEFSDRVFRIFQRLHTRSEYPGNGIGLALCQRIVERHGGKIMVDKDVDRGTAISFTLRGAA